MATVLDEALEPRRKGPKPKYPWDEWLDGRTRLLTPGEDFDVKTSTMRAMVYQQAYKRGMRAVTELHGPVGSESIKVRAFAPAGEENA